EHCVVLRKLLGVARRVFRDFGLRRRESTADLEIALAWERQKIRKRPGDDRQAVVRETEVANDLRIEQADRVARGRVAKSGMEFFGNRRAADDATALDNAHRRARVGEISGADEAVVTAADDDGVEHRYSS